MYSTSTIYKNYWYDIESSCSIDISWYWWLSAKKIFGRDVTDIRGVWDGRDVTDIRGLWDVTRCKRWYRCMICMISMRW